jgi:hypothetical protein
MIINGTEASQHELSYDKIIKNTLAQSNEMTIRFINGLFDDNIPLTAPVEWLDKESVDNKYSAIVADFYPRIDGKMYAIEIEHDGSGDMAIRVFKYTVGGAMLHSMTSTKAELNITFPQPCVAFLSSTKSTPKELLWNIDFFDGQKVSLKIPTIRLAELSIEEIARRNLLPIGQFYLRTFETLTKSKVEKFIEATKSLLLELKRAVDNGSVPYRIGVQMEGTIRKTFENVVVKSEKEVDLVMTTNITETIPWTDFSEVFDKLEAKGRAEGEARGRAEGEAKGRSEGRAEGEAKGRAERDREIVKALYSQYKQGSDNSPLIDTMKVLGITDETIEAALKQYETKSAQ